MRRTLFGKSPELERLAPPRASIARCALRSTSRDQQASADMTLAERRVDSWTFAPVVASCRPPRRLPQPLVADGRSAVRTQALRLSSCRSPLRLRSTLAAGLVLLGWRRLQMAPHVDRPHHVRLCRAATGAAVDLVGSVATERRRSGSSAASRSRWPPASAIGSIVVGDCSPPLAIDQRGRGDRLDRARSRAIAADHLRDRRSCRCVLVAYSVASTRRSSPRGARASRSNGRRRRR